MMENFKIKHNKIIGSKIFDDTETAFKTKSDKELNRGILLFSLMKRNGVVKVGALVTRLALKLHLPVEGLIGKTIFAQFCGGTTEESCRYVISEIFKVQVHSILDYSVEGKQTERQFDSTLAKKLELIEVTGKSKELPFSVFKPTAIGRFSIWEKVSSNIELNENEQQEWNRTKERVNMLCRSAYRNNVRLYADAEESWIQGAVDDLMEEMMRKYNKEQVIIYNTIQCYRWDRFKYIKELHSKAKTGNFKIGVKIVRGAYMEKENTRARIHNYPTPICVDKKATDRNFNNVMTFCLSNLNNIHVFIGSHNETSIYLAINIMKEKRLEENDKRIWFSQLYGMSDNISYNLAKRGYNVAKLLPFGPVREVIPYLMRRAQENTSVKGQTGRELSLLRREKKRREAETGEKKIDGDRNFLFGPGRN